MVDEVHPDALLLDMVMPEMGDRCAPSPARPGIPGGIIIMTGSHNEELLGEAWSLGPHELLVKPVDLDRLLMAIQLVLVCREC